MRATRSIEPSKAQRDRLSAYISTKKLHPCLDCKQTYHPFVMDFDHVRGEKLADVADMANQRYTEEAIDAEIAKCDLVCSNCHRMRTWNRNHQ
jgi:hypothetical protein